MKVGIRVTCAVCGSRKAPIGRDASPEQYLCNDDCSGYGQEPFVGSLWPGETEEEFGYSVGVNGTREVE